MKALTYFRVKLWKNIPEEVCGNLIKKYKRNQEDYYRVIIFDNYSDMYEYADKYFYEEEKNHDYSGICKYSSKAYYEDGEYVDTDRCCGWILLHKDRLGGGTVSHECSHAVTFYFEFRIHNCKKVFGTEEYNELFAYMLGSIVNQIYHKVYLKKVII